MVKSPQHGGARRRWRPARVGTNGFICVFDVDTGAFVTTLEVPPSEVWGVQFHPKDVSNLKMQMS